MEFDATTLVNYGALGICLAYFIYKDNKTSRELKDALDGVKDLLTVIRERVTKFKDEE